jgi:DNA polymerase-3 subunit alpha
MAGKELNRRAVESLIRAGAFDSLGLCRKALVQIVDKVMECISADGKRNIDGQLDLFCFGEEEAVPEAGITLPDVPEFTRERAHADGKGNHRALSQRAPDGRIPGRGPPGGRCGHRRGPGGFFRRRRAKRFEDNQIVTVAGVVASQRTRTTRTGSLMSNIQLEDDSGTMELIAFQKALDAGGGYVAEGAALFVKGKISVRDEKEPQLMVDSIRPISDLNPVGSDLPPPAKKKLWIRLPSRDSDAFRRIGLILEMFPGDDRMVIFLEDTGERLGHDCVIHDALVAELNELLGEKNVVIQ